MKLSTHRICRFALTLAFAVILASIPARASVISSGTVNIPVSATFDGTWLNMVTGGVDQNIVDGTAGWDIDVWVTNGAAWRLFANGNASNPDNGILGSVSTATVLADGALIDGSATFLIGAHTIPTLGTNLHGIELWDESDSAIHYGWVRITLSSGPFSGAIVDCAYESQAGVGILAGATGVPEPSTILLVGAAAAFAIVFSRLKTPRV